MMFNIQTAYNLMFRCYCRRVCAKLTNLETLRMVTQCNNLRGAPALKPQHIGFTPPVDSGNVSFQVVEAEDADFRRGDFKLKE